MSNAPKRSRSFERIEIADLTRLAEITLPLLAQVFERREAMRSLYADKLIGICLCQGAASHFLRVGSADTPGINDFDVWAFYELANGVAFHNRKASHADFGVSKFGRNPSERKRYKGRRVDVFWRAIPARIELDPLAPIRRYFASAQTSSACELRKKPAIAIWPNPHEGEILWNPATTT